MDEHRVCNNPEYREMISAYIDGDLDAAERQTLLAHLAVCDECRATLEAYRHIGGQLRAMPPVTPPVEMREAIYAATIDSGPRRLYVFSSRLGYSMAALAAVLLIFIVAIYLIVNGYQRSIDPEVVASEPASGVIWPLSRPIEITFNKEMDRESVEAALSISPASERERLTKTWDGNTLILGANQTLRPHTTYSISITRSAEDRWGTNLGSDFKLQFESSESFALQTPEPLPTATPVPSPTTIPSPTEDASVSQPTEPDQPVAQPTATPRESSEAPGEGTSVPESTSEPGEPAGPPTATPESSDEPEEPGFDPEPPTATPADQEPEPPADPTSTPTPRPTATPDPTSTPRPLPTATPTAPDPTATPVPPTATPTPDTVPVVGPFGNVYWSNEIVMSRLGAPTAAAYSITGVELDFQHGAMFSRSDSDQTYVLESSSAFWSVVPSSNEEANSAPGPIEGTWVPGGSLGALWAAESWIQAAIGHALAPSGQVFESRVQSFENGTMLMSASGQIYVLYGDGTWELYPDPGS